MKVRIIIALIALICTATQSFASEPLVVDKLIYNPTDLSASNAPKDMNGNSCGLLKVITNDKSMTFEGSIVGTPEYKNGEYWVYLITGTYRVRIKSSITEPLMLDFKDYNLNRVESKFTYELSFRPQSDTSNIYISNAYRCLESGKIDRARSFYNYFVEMTGHHDLLFETELSKADGTYIWSEEELLNVGFKCSTHDGYYDKDPYVFVPIIIDNYNSALIEEEPCERRIINGNVSNGYVNGLTLIEYDDFYYDLAYVCMGKIMAPFIRVLKKPILIFHPDPHAEERNCLTICETVVANGYDIYNSEELKELDEGWGPYIKQIFGSHVVNQDFFHNFTNGEVDMDEVKRNFNNFMINGNKIPKYLWNFK